LSGGLPAIVQRNALSDTVTVELLLSAPSEGGTHPEDLPGLDAVMRSGAAEELSNLVRQSVTAASQRRPAERRSADPATRLEQLIASQMALHTNNAPTPLAVIVSGNVEPGKAFDLLERQVGPTRPGEMADATTRAASNKIVRERIPKPLSQGGLGYVVEAPPPGTRESLVWRMLLYVLTHDYSGRLGRSAIGAKGIVYYIGSGLRTDGRRSWVTISTGVDPDKADAMEAELRTALAGLVSEPPAAAEVDAARNHLLGRDLTAAQSNEELVAKLARDFVETGGLTSHEQLRAQLQTITPADLANAARAFGRGTIIRLDVGATQ
jgi:predicted Zn-dependent peptidase